jgi:hypothetical protein
MRFPVREPDARNHVKELVREFLSFFSEFPRASAYLKPAGPYENDALPYAGMKAKLFRGFRCW